MYAKVISYSLLWSLSFFLFVVEVIINTLMWVMIMSLIYMSFNWTKRQFILFNVSHILTLHTFSELSGCFLTISFPKQNQFTGLKVIVAFTLWQNVSVLLYLSKSLSNQTDSLSHLQCIFFGVSQHWLFLSRYFPFTLWLHYIFTVFFVFFSPLRLFLPLWLSNCCLMFSFSDWSENY